MKIYIKMYNKYILRKKFKMSNLGIKKTYIYNIKWSVSKCKFLLQYMSYFEMNINVFWISGIIFFCLNNEAWQKMSD